MTVSQFHLIAINTGAERFYSFSRHEQSGRRREDIPNLPRVWRRNDAGCNPPAPRRVARASDLPLHGVRRRGDRAGGGLKGRAVAALQARPREFIKISMPTSFHSPSADVMKARSQFTRRLPARHSNVKPAMFRPEAGHPTESPRVVGMMFTILVGVKHVTTTALVRGYAGAPVDQRAGESPLAN